MEIYINVSIKFVSKRPWVNYEVCSSPSWQYKIQKTANIRQESINSLLIHLILYKPFIIIIWSLQSTLLLTYISEKTTSNFVKKRYRSKATEFDSKCIVELPDECQQLTVDNSEHVIEEIIIVPYIMKNKYYKRIQKLFMITPNHSASNANIIRCVSSYIDIIYINCRLKEPIFAAD